MPRISEFYGIAIYMYYRDHPPPHFHAIYGEFDAEFSISTAEIVQGELPRTARQLVEQWASLRRLELQHDWDLARAGEPLEWIDPLD